jgi:hypothetical protein
MHARATQKYVFGGSLLVDIEFSEEKMNEFFDKTKDEFDKLTRAYVKKISSQI